MISVIVNQWTGEGPRYPHCYCWACREAVSVAEIADPGGALLVRLCAGCLWDAYRAIGRAILEEVRHDAKHRNLSGNVAVGHGGHSG